MTSAPATVRPATLADAPALAALSGQLGYPVAADGVAERLARLLEEPDQTVWVACADGSRVIGWIHGGERTLLESEPDCEILGLVVDGAFRRHGIGRQLVAALERWAAARGLGVVVRSNILRADSHPFYEGLDYRRTKTQHVYRKDLAHAGARTD
jgi:ribosomal protein S18 acetylase RimI-like enzyme